MFDILRFRRPLRCSVTFGSVFADKLQKAESLHELGPIHNGFEQWTRQQSLLQNTSELTVLSQRCSFSHIGHDLNTTPES